MLWVIDGARISNRRYDGIQPDIILGAMVERVEGLKEARAWTTAPRRPQVLETMEARGAGGRPSNEADPPAPA